MPRILAALCVALSLGVSAAAQCRAPRFRKGRDYGGSMYVSIRPKDFTLDSLTCLGQTLRKNRRAWKSFQVLFFTSRDGAYNFSPAPIEVQRAWWSQWARKLHAGYFFDAEKHEEYLEIMPLGYEDESYYSKVVLPLAATPHCRLDIAGRCLTAVGQPVAYPEDALRARASGRIVLTGTINRSGGVTGLQVAEADVNPREEKESLVNATILNLNTWQFDSAKRDDLFRINYSYVIHTLLARGSMSEVVWALPNEITVRGNPPE